MLVSRDGNLGIKKPKFFAAPVPLEQEDLDLSEPVLNCGFGGARSKDLLDTWDTVKGFLAMVTVVGEFPIIGTKWMEIDVNGCTVNGCK